MSRHFNPLTATTDQLRATAVTNAAKATVDVLEVLEEWRLEPEAVKNILADALADYTARDEARAEAEWEDRQAPSDASYRRDMIAAGRGHLLGG